MENEEEKRILPESEPQESVCTETGTEIPEPIPDTAEELPVSADDPVEEIPEPTETEAAAPDEVPTPETLEDGSRVLHIPKGYEAYPDGWYPRNPVRRFMERWGAFLNLGLTLVLIAVLIGFAASLRPIRIADPEPTEPAPLPTEEQEIVPVPTEDEVLPTMPDVPVQTDCFTVKDGVLSFDVTKFDPVPVLKLPDTLNGQQIVAIADGAFEGLSGVTSVLIPEGIRTLGVRAFADCKDLRGVGLADSVKKIGSEAFRNCPALEGMYMPGSVLEIGEGAFDDCAALRYIFFNGPYSRWERLYEKEISPFTFILCLDGEFPHGAQLPD